MFNKSRKFFSVCGITSLLIAGLVSAGYAKGNPHQTTKTWSLYNQYCSGCHGTSKQGSSASAIQNAISRNAGGMGSLSSLSSSQIRALAAGQ
jgi:hypothetical protein